MNGFNYLIHLRYRNLILFLFYACLTMLVYWNTASSKFTSDIFQMFNAFERNGVGGILNSFGDWSLKYVFQGTMFFLYKILGHWDIGWHLLFALLHALTAVLVFVFITNLLKKLNLLNPEAPAFLISILFLISPFQTEAVGWAATLHYLMAAIIVLTSNIYLLNYFESPKRKTLLLIHLLYFISLFTTEAIIILPFIHMVIFILFSFTKTPRFSWGHYIQYIFLPQLGFVILFLFMSHLFLGKVIAHYGAETHLNADPVLIGSTYIKYLLKFFLFYRYLLPDHKWVFLKYIENPLLVYSVIAFFSGLAGFLCYRINKLTIELKIVAALFLVYSVSLLPVLNLDSSFMYSMAADRYGYIPSIFFYSFLILTFYFFLPKLYIMPSVFFIGLSAFFLADAVAQRAQAGAITKSLIENFSWENKRHVYILNVIDNYNGVYVFANGLPEALKFKYQKDLQDKIHILAKYNMFAPEDSVEIKSSGNQEYIVNVSPWGRWFWQTRSHETDLYKLEIEPPCNCVYKIKFKNLHSEDVIIYQAGKEWKVLN